MSKAPKSAEAPPIEVALPGLESMLRPVLASLASAAERRGTHRVLFASPESGAGTTTIATGTALLLAKYIGARTTLVEADIYLPSAHTYLSMAAEPGLLDVFDGRVALEKVERKGPYAGLSVFLGGGRRRGQPGELAAGGAREALEALTERPGIVVLDAPPVLEHPDAAIPLSRADEVYLVVRAGVTRKDSALRALEVLNASSAQVTGVILNGERRDAPWPFGT